MAGLSQDDPMHLWIVSAADQYCNTCSCRSANFTVLDEVMTNTSSSASASSTSSPSATTTPTGTYHSMKLGLGLGLGLGVPLLVVLTALGTWFCMRRRRRTGLVHDGFLQNLSPSATAHLNPDEGYTPSSLGYASSSPEEKLPLRELDGSHVVVEMHTDSARVEAPLNAVPAELEGNVGSGAKHL